ncbi:MAG: 4-hydroxy-3-methylbut-2-en-1-yl diphosphate synthase [Candidatus Marinimicrobia bacterium]|nr:4-hydroxy-3-methylbut-2-en-1-yl diphosphate synthase [Candidatus Neomarinimicrobiota bacterium]
MKDEQKNNLYCNSLTSYSRFKTREVNIGGVALGGSNPIRVQSMTTTDTMDTHSTVAQSIRMIEAGCEYVRITAPSINEAKNLLNIKNELKSQGYSTPLIADIHFTPNAAQVAARIIEKVRINPGNYADRKKFNYIDYTDQEYNDEINRIRDRFLPLVNICKEYGTAMRIGTNHGSLSDRILSRYGDTPMGMVESAMEFLRICNDESYHDIVLSMKSSNPIVMVQAYRLLINCMVKENMNYPLHLGVTEAGEGQDGRIKSALGIGTLLEDGLGDTIRVSLTEEPEFEIPVAKKLVERYSNRSNHSEIEKINIYPINPFEYNLRKSCQILNIGGDNVPRIINDLSYLSNITSDTLLELGYTYFKKDDKWGISDLACDYIDIGNKEIDFEIPGTLGVMQKFSTWKDSKKKQHYPCLDIEEYLNSANIHLELNFLHVTLYTLTKQVLDKIKNDPTVVLLLDTQNQHGLADQRRIFIKLINAQIDVPVIIGRYYGDLTSSDLQLYSSTDIGGLFIDGLGDGLYIAAKNCGSIESVNRTSFGILQATRTRVTKTEYISCPSCGRTLFDLQEVTARIRSKTQHLKGLKIGIMGCIVNGPGEMADADYGYVGTGIGKISLYKKQDIVNKDVPMEKADDALIDLIKSHGDWVEP